MSHQKNFQPNNQGKKSQIPAQLTQGAGGGYVTTAGGEGSAGAGKRNWKQRPNSQKEEVDNKQSQSWDFKKYPFNGEPTRVVHLQKQLLQEAKSQRVLQLTMEGGDSWMTADSCFTTADFYYIVRDLPVQPLHQLGEDEQTRRDVESMIVNWKIELQRINNRNDSMEKFWNHFAEESTGWLRSRVSAKFWLYLLDSLGEITPFVFWTELNRVGGVVGSISSVLADNQRFSQVLSRWDPSSVQPHEFIARFMQYYREDQAIRLPDGTMVDPREDANWTAVDKERAHRMLYRLWTVHQTFVDFKLPGRYTPALEKFFSSPTEYVTYSEKVEAILKECAKIDTSGEMWDGAKRQPRQPQSNQKANVTTQNSSGTPVVAQRPALPPSIRTLVCQTSNLTKKEVEALPAESRDVLVVNALKSRLSEPLPAPPATPSSSRCHCGVQDMITNCRTCLEQALSTMGVQPGAALARSPETSKQRVADAVVSAAASVGQSPGLSPNLQHIAQTALARQAAAASGPATNTRGFTRKVKMISKVECRDPAYLSVFRTTLNPSHEDVSAAQKRLATHPSFVVDSGSELTGVCPQDMLLWKPHTQVEYPEGYMSGQSCSGENLTLLGQGVTVERWPMSTAVLQLQDRVLSVKEFTGLAHNQDVYFPAQSRGLPFGVVFADANTGMVTDIGDYQYRVQPHPLPHFQRGDPWMLRPHLSKGVVGGAPSVKRIDAAEMVQHEAGLAVFDSLKQCDDDDDDDVNDLMVGEWYPLPTSHSTADILTQPMTDEEFRRHSAQLLLPSFATVQEETL